jgi:hypothetical protein
LLTNVTCEVNAVIEKLCVDGPARSAGIERP